MRLAIVGCRSFQNFEFLEKTLFEKLKMDYITEIVTGGALGADSLGMAFAKKYEIPLTVFYPDWKKYGRSAGFLRNEVIVKNSDHVIAFWDYQSKGTKSTINIAIKELGEDAVTVIDINTNR